MNKSAEAELERLAARCRGEVLVTFNPHTVNYQSVEDYLAGTHLLGERVSVPAEFKYLVEVQFYPRTPIGFELVRGFDLAGALAEAHRILDAREGA